MGSVILFEQSGHRNVLLESLGGGEAVPSNHHLIVHGTEAMLLDPGGHKVFSQAMVEVNSELKGARLTELFLSHQDPDIIAALNGWLMTTDAMAHVSALWIRFVPHFGLDRLAVERLRPIPDEGMKLMLGGSPLWLLPAHFLHSAGNFHVWDPTSKLLYTGDLGASLGEDTRIVEDFDAHIPFMVGFHERYLACGAALHAWVRMVRGLDIEGIAPQHGAMMLGKANVGRFLDWCEGLRCGIDLLEPLYRLPPELTR